MLLQFTDFSLLFIFAFMVNSIFSTFSPTVSGRAEDENEKELTNYQLQRLVEENVLRKADIAKLPCIRRNRRCLVESIKERGWKNQKKLNNILNTILKINNEKQFIDQAVKLMIEDNSDLLKGSKNDEDILARYSKKGKKRTSKKEKKSKAHTKRSFIPTHLDFLNTDLEANDFNEESAIDNDYVIGEENADLASLFSPEEREYAASFKEENHKRSFVPEFFEDQNVDNEDSQESFFPTEESNLENKVMKKSMIQDGSEFGNGANFIYNQDTQLGWQQNPNANYYHNNDIYRNGYFEQGGESFENNAQFYGNAVPNTNAYNRDYIESNYQNPYDTFNVQQQQSDFSEQTEDTLPTTEHTTQEITTKTFNQPTKGYRKEKIPKEEPGHKRDSNVNKKNFTYNIPYPQNVVPIEQQRADALTKMKTEAMEHMMKMQNVKVTIDKPTRRLTKYEKARLAHRQRQQKFKKLYKTDQDLYSGMNELNSEDETDLQESIKNLELGWDLDLDEKKSENENDDENMDSTEYELSDSSLQANTVEQPTSVTDSSVPITKKHATMVNKVSKKSKKQHKSPTAVSRHKDAHNKPLPTNNGAPKTHQEPVAEAASVKSSTGDVEVTENGGVPTPEMHYRYPILGGAKAEGGGQQNQSLFKGNITLANVQTTVPPPMIMNSGPTIANQQVHHNSTSTVVPATGNVKASRVCKPGVMKTYFEGKPNCLIIGDSIALGYSYSAAAALNGSCQVQLAPSSKAGVAMDTGYAKQCLDYFLSTISLQPTEYDVILFNFGLHDIDYLDKYPEESHDISTYVNNLKTIKRRLLDTGATVGFVLSTPVTYNKSKDEMIRRYNHAAKRVMENGDDKVMTINLHKIVTRECGPVPFENCYMMKKPHDVHYGVTGSIMLGKRVASAISYLLKKRKFQRSWTALTPSSVELATNKTVCALPGTACPADAVCMNNIVSRSGHACCQLQGGVDCGDSWHCCPAGTSCHPQCSDTKCSCIAK